MKLQNQYVLVSLFEAVAALALVGCGGGGSTADVTAASADSSEMEADALRLRSKAPAPAPAPVPAPTPASIASSVWTRVAGENEPLAVTGTQTVRYGSGTHWITLTVTGNATCTNGFFGSDPLYGVRKECQVSSTAPASALATVAPTTPAPVPSPTPVSGAPAVKYTDAVTGPITGGEGNNGAYLSVFGTNFGSPSGLGTTTKVYIGGVEVSNYRYLGNSKVGGKLGLQQLTVQVGNLGNPTLGVALPVKVVVNGVQSTTSSTFTPSVGRILFVSLTGSDSSALPNDISRPWRNLQAQGTSSGAYFAAGPGDHIVIRGGNWSDTNGWDGTWMRTAGGSAARNGTPSAWIHVTAYPGPINGNAIEDVHYSTPAGKSGGIAGPWSGIAGTSGEYFSVSNLRMDVNAAAASDAAPINLQYTGGHWRIVNNELGPWPVAGVSSAKAGGLTGYGDDVKVFGNHIHDIGGTSALENHGIYVETFATNWELAYNWVHDITGGSLVQFHDSVGLQGTGVLPHGGVWPGFIGMRLHNNWLENSAKYGLNIGDAGALIGKVELQAWNNVIMGTKLPPFRMASSATVMDITFAYNTIHNAMVSNSGSGNGYFRNEWFGSGAIRIYDNVLSQGASTVAGTEWFYDYSGTSSGWTFRNNLYWDAGRGLALPADPTALAGDPKFTNAAGGDLSLGAGSPAIDKALQTVPFTVTDDMSAKVPRPSGSANDVGAFERAQ